MMSDDKKTYGQRGLQYALDVVAGRIVAGEWVIKACRRHIEDLKKQADKNYPFVFDDERAENICEFIEKLKHVKGKWADTFIVLEPWQIFIATCVFGWVAKSTGYRRFKVVYLEEGRKNAKSTFLAAVGLYMLVADGEAGAEIYSAATTGEQANIVFSAAQQMARKSKDLCSAFGIQINAHNLSVQGTQSKYRALNSEDNSLDGLNPHLGGLDELHAHKTRGLFDVISSAMGSRTQPILWIITTAGTNLIGICYEQRTYVTKILDGVFEDDSYFGIIYSIDKDDDWKDPSVWVKANPNLGVSVYVDDMERECTRAKNNPAALNNFLTKRLNVWCNANSAWMNMDKWRSCFVKGLRLEDFEGQPCFVGLDLASKIDIAAKVLLFPLDDRKFAVFGKYYIPASRLDPDNNNNAAQYNAWARDGRLVVTPGNIIDFRFIKEDLLADAKKFDLLEVGYDPFQATQFVVEAGEEGLTMVEVGATVRNFSEPMKWVEALVETRALQHDGDPVLAWMMSCVTAHYDKKENIYPNKEGRDSKIDGVVAMLMAFNRAQYENRDASVYEERGLVVI